jgi:alginate O-acetyltransferase complex protein AlgI
MVFSSPIFLFLFLPVTLVLYLLLPGLRLRNLWLLAVSLLFYAWGEAAFVLLIFVSTMVNYGLGLWVESGAGTSRRKWGVVLAVVFNLGLLGFFKYGNFLVENLNLLARPLHLGAVHLGKVRLPIGISFFTFHALSYIIDIYRGKMPAARRPSDMALYIFFFPQLVAGPILRWGAMAPQIAGRIASLDGFWEGIRRFVQGLAKKTLVANTVAAAADRVFSLSPDALSLPMAWVGVVCYTLQIYFDFSGYSDMAIGLGRMFGFTFMENFDHPYIAQSIKDFWRRWHISLSSWFRDYLYVPLGGNRCSAARNYANLLVVFLLCGLWHGAAWTFVVWGLYHGLFLVLERTRFGSWLESFPRPLRHAYALAVVMVGWVIFRADTWPQAVAYLRALLGLGPVAGLTPTADVFLTIGTVFGLTGEDTISQIAATNQIPLAVLTHQVVWAMLAGIVFSTPFASWFKHEVLRTSPEPLRPAIRLAGILAEPVALSALLVVSAAWLADGTYNPFIYFRF